MLTTFLTIIDRDSAVSFASMLPSSAFKMACSIILLVSPAANLTSSASFLISSATTAKPFPASPALADSIAAFKQVSLLVKLYYLLFLLLVLFVVQLH